MKHYVLFLLSLALAMHLLLDHKQLNRHLLRAELIESQEFIEPVSQNQRQAPLSADKNLDRDDDQRRLCKAIFMDGVEPMSSNQAHPQLELWRRYQCNGIFCNPTAEGTQCQWSNFAIATLLENATRVCDAAHVKEFFLPGPKWNTYQLANFLKDFHDNETGTFEGSIAAAIDDTKDASREEGLARVVAERIAAQTPNPQMNRTVVIHLRLGDVIDLAVESLHDLLWEQKWYARSCNGQVCPGLPIDYPDNPPLQRKWNRYVKPLSYFSKLQGLEDYESVVLLGGAHNTKDATRSCHYTTAVQAYLERKLPRAQVTLRLGGLPDEDVLFAAQAGKCIPTGGGFSKLLAQLNRAMKEGDTRILQ